jgi:hypothetical protein
MSVPEPEGLHAILHLPISVVYKKLILSQNTVNVIEKPYILLAIASNIKN